MNLSPKQVEEVNGYLSTPKFIKYLTDTSVALGSEQDKKEGLKRKLRDLNSYLPAAVYVPFVMSSMRNYAVLHIPPSECHVFQTKERAPFMITLEVFRPEEIFKTKKPTIPRVIP